MQMGEIHLYVAIFRLFHTVAHSSSIPGRWRLTSGLASSREQMDYRFLLLDDLSRIRMQRIVAYPAHCIVNRSRL